MADDGTVERLKGLARDRGVSFAEVVREALDDKAREHRPTPRSLGIGASETSCTAAEEGTRRVPPRSWR